ncbi:tetratricopeptide repeat protein [Polynucleobacter sp. Nonnen-W13]|uniref:tetratricopeptide repeat-containing glycosyltransferase family protein n=1 Tax=Polynucleobacter sp. Nonnen-W13 TaxID=1855625 RepID=UPI001C0CA1F0|nr:tetratricopeptide repeat protein [Polynucleobacter sp. Nonnen-W13]MBU3558175.1 tetratricopeptide repeat protein [Polynucleobacter sp. Nonnen-W13]
MDIGSQILLENSLQLIKTGELEKAQDLLVKGLKSLPNSPDFLRLSSVVAAMQFDFSSALNLIDRVIDLAPDYAIAYSNRGNILKDLGRYEEALSSLNKAISLQPNYAEAYCNIGNVLQDLHRNEEALSWYDNAIALDPNYAGAYNNKGNALVKLKRYQIATESYNIATAINPGYAECYYAKSMLQLSTGNFKEGWKNYEARWHLNHPVKFQFSDLVRLEHLQDISGKNILIWAEQGLGDSIQFSRYIEPLCSFGAKITFLVPDLLINIFAPLRKFCTLVSSIENQTKFDFHSPLLSLPMLFDTTLESIPSKNPYLMADPNMRDIFKGRLGDTNNFKVGVVWSGGFRVYRPELWSFNKRRNIELERIAKLKDVSGINFYSLQKGDPAESELIAKGPELWPNIIHCVKWLDDFSDTAALIENLDLIISVDTSTAHLAGALGKPVWILNRHDSCWRWLSDRSDSPWYPTAKIYQQSDPGNWDGVLEEVKTDLSALALKHLNQ